MLIRNLYIAVVVAVFALPAYASGVDVGAAEAENAIMSFFSAVSSGDYAAADDYYGGTYAALQEWNPDLDPIDFPGLWRQGCGCNGLRCLAVRRIVECTKLKPRKYRLVVEFQTSDGELFVRRTAEADDSAAASSESTFAYIVEDKGDGYQVEGLPPYIP